MSDYMPEGGRYGGERPSDPAWYRVNAMAGCAVVTAGGEIDLDTSTGLRDALQRATELSYRVVVDLEDVAFLDSTGLSMLVTALKRTREHGGGVGLVSPTGVVSRVLATTTLDRVFPVYESVEDAVGPAPAT